MSQASAPDVLRPAVGSAKGWLLQLALTLAPRGLSVLRGLGIIRLGSYYVVTRHDDVREVFGTDGSFGVPYATNLGVITGGEPFFLGMSDTPAYRFQLQAMRRVFVSGDLAALGDKAETMAGAAVAASGGQIDVVALIRQITFDLLGCYIGIPEPQDGRLDVWATRLFEFQFTGRPGDTDLTKEVCRIAPSFRDHIDREIARRKSLTQASEATTNDAQASDVLGRCLALQATGVPGFDDVAIRTAMLCMIVGGPPQPPMVVPQAVEQLLRRPAALSAAQDAARKGQNELLRALVREAMRFDPLAPGLPRVALQDYVVAAGTSRATTIPKGATVFVAFSSAMLDPRRVPSPGRFDAGRLPHEYIHFGYGLHECFGLHINQAVLHRMLKPLLCRPRLRRANGAEGRLRKRGIFADQLIVLYD